MYVEERGVLNCISPTHTHTGIHLFICQSGLINIIVQDLSFM